MTQTVAADAVVAGAGMAGLVTAVDLADRGADVLVLEKADEPGGSMRLSNGIVWTYLPYEAIRERAPDGDPDLQRVLAERFEDDLDWLDSVGAELEEPDFDVEGPGMMIDPPAFTEHMVDRLESAGGTLRTGTGFESVRTEDGRVVGADATTPDGERLRVNAENVVLATGGFQGNEELVERYVTDATDNLYLRSNPESTGDAFLAARDVGAQTTGGLGTFYGHTLAAPPADVTLETLADATQYYGYAAVALDASGDRFTDESESPLEETLAQDVASMADGRAFYVFDEHIADDAYGYTTADDILDSAADLGGRAARVDTLAGLREVLDDWGANGRRAVETVREYNRAMRNDRRPEPPRENERYPLDSPPYRVVAVQAAITFTMGGLAVTPDMQVKRRSASRSGMSLVDEDGEDGVIEGLYAAGCDVGNVHRRAYVGGLALGLVSGRVAAEDVAE